MGHVPAFGERADDPRPHGRVLAADARDQCARGHAVRRGGDALRAPDPRVRALHVGEVLLERVRSCRVSVTTPRASRWQGAEVLQRAHQPLPLCRSAAATREPADARADRVVEQVPAHLQQVIELARRVHARPGALGALRVEEPVERLARTLLGIGDLEQGGHLLETGELLFADLALGVEQGVHVPRDAAPRRLEEEHVSMSARGFGEVGGGRRLAIRGRPHPGDEDGEALLRRLPALDRPLGAHLGEHHAPDALDALHHGQQGQGGPSEGARLDRGERPGLLRGRAARQESEEQAEEARRPADGGGGRHGTLLGDRPRYRACRGGGQACILLETW